MLFEKYKIKNIGMQIKDYRWKMVTGCRMLDAG